VNKIRRPAAAVVNRRQWRQGAASELSSTCAGNPYPGACKVLRTFSAISVGMATIRMGSILDSSLFCKTNFADSRSFPLSGFHLQTFLKGEGVPYCHSAFILAPGRLSAFADTYFRSVISREILCQVFTTQFSNINFSFQFVTFSLAMRFAEEYVFATVPRVWVEVNTGAIRSSRFLCNQAAHGRRS
jgi:hypothetical protein